MNTQDAHKIVADYIRSHPDDTFFDIAKTLGIGISTISRIAKMHGLSRPGSNRIKLNMELMNEGAK